MTRVRRAWWRYVRRWQTELCQSCGRPVAKWLGSWWHAPDELWLTIVGRPEGVLCPRCFTEKCDERGLLVYWTPQVSVHTRPLDGR